MEEYYRNVQFEIMQNESRRFAHWIAEIEYPEFQTQPNFKCSNCGEYDPVEYERFVEKSALNFCPWCGCYMKGE